LSILLLGCGKVEESVESFQLAVFKGTYRHRIDPKGRVPVPAAFRRALAEGGQARLVATVLDQCLAVYPLAEWQRLEGQLRQLPAFSREVKALTRMLASRAADCELDVQGRILLPAPLRAAAELAGEVVVIGVVDRFELWAPERWADFVRDSERLLDHVSLGVQWPALPPPPPPAASPAPREAPARRRRPQEKPNR
jgi:MraZ protein